MLRYDVQICICTDISVHADLTVNDIIPQDKGVALSAFQGIGKRGLILMITGGRCINSSESVLGKRRDMHSYLAQEISVHGTN